MTLEQITKYVQKTVLEDKMSALSNVLFGVQTRSLDYDDLEFLTRHGVPNSEEGVEEEIAKIREMLECLE
jgi:hypothetical protein